MVDLSKYDPKIVALFKHYDLNENFSLERQELAKGLTDLFKSLEPNMDQEKMNSLTDEVIKTYDLNGNGMIEIDEFSNLVNFLIEEKGLDLN